MPLNIIMRSAVRYQLCLILSKMLRPLAFNFELLIQLAVFLKWVEASTNCQFICAKLLWRFHADLPLGVSAVCLGAIPFGLTIGQ